LSYISSRKEQKLTLERKEDEECKVVLLLRRITDMIKEAKVIIRALPNLRTLDDITIKGITYGGNNSG
jgi:hypothetical protein